MTADIDPRVLGVVQQLGYDFQHFTLEHFIAHLIWIRQREIFLREYPFDPELHAFWVRAASADYVFCNQDAHIIHKVHNILHELGHIILEHPGHNITQMFPKALRVRLGLSETSVLYGGFRMIEPAKTPEEQEAEAFVRYLQKEIIFANRTHQLVRRSSSIAELEKFARSLGYHD